MLLVVAEAVEFDEANMSTVCVKLCGMAGSTVLVEAFILVGAAWSVDLGDDVLHVWGPHVVSCVVDAVGSIWATVALLLADIGSWVVASD